MNKRLRSRVLAASIVSGSFIGAGGILSQQQVVHAQDVPSAASELQRGSRLFDQKNYGEAKKVLADIDPGQLPEDQRSRRADLLTKTDIALAAAMGPNQRFDNAQQDLDAGRLALAAAKFQAIADDGAAPAEVKDNAKIKLALVQQKQKDQIPKMKELLDQSQGLYDQGKLDDAQNALNAVTAVGGDLGWDTNNRIPQLQQRISEKKLAIARGGTGAGSVMAAIPSGGAGAMPVGAGPAPMDAVPATGMAAPAAPGSLMEQYQGIQRVERERVVTLYNEAKHASDEALAKNQFAQAITQAQAAVDMIEQNPTLFSDIESQALRDAAQRQLANAKAQNEQYQRQMEVTLEERTRIDERNRIASTKQIRDAKVAALVADAHKLYDAAQFKEAADILRQATIINPQDTNAQFFLRIVLTKIVDRDAEVIMHRTGQEVMRQNIDSAEHLIPYADLMVYPDNWPEITRKRGGGESSQDTAGNRSVRDRLEESLKEISADQQGLEKVLNYLRDNMGANIFVNWPVLQTAGVERNTPVTVNLKEVPFRKALTTILAQVSTATAVLTYTIEDGIITISTVEDLSSAKYQSVRVFDIRDMLVQPNPNAQAPRINLAQSGGGGGGGQNGGGGGGGNFGGGGGGGSQQSLFTDTGTTQGTNTTNTQQRQDLVNSLMDTIKSTVARDSWVDNGGRVGSIRELNGQLIINQTVDNQLQVYGLLQQLRETRAIQIAVEARLLLVANNFLDDFRIGWDLTLPVSSLAGGAFNIGNQNTFAQSVPGSTGVPGSIASFATLPSLNLSASILDSFTLNLLLNATQADRRTITVTAPRVTLFNGVNGFIAVTNQQNFVGSVNQTAASGGINGGAATATTLNIQTLQTGVVLDVTATVSADRRYVVMTITPTLSTLDGIDTFTTSVAAPVTGNNTNNNNSNNTTTAVGGAFVQLPKISQTSISTMVSIPDGGTLLIGGQKLVGEAEVEVGVPVLSKIPGLNRFFTNRSYVKDERTLLVLVRPNIIIHREIENDLFGVGYDRPTGLPGNSGPSSGSGSSYLGGPTTGR